MSCHGYHDTLTQELACVDCRAEALADKLEDERGARPSDAEVYELLLLADEGEEIAAEMRDEADREADTIRRSDDVDGRRAWGGRC